MLKFAQWGVLHIGTLTAHRAAADEPLVHLTEIRSGSEEPLQDADANRAELRRWWGQLEYCYERYLKTPQYREPTPLLESYDVALEVSNRRVTSVDPVEDVEPALFGCIESKMRRWRPSQTFPAQVVLTMTFTPRAFEVPFDDSQGLECGTISGDEPRDEADASINEPGAPDSGSGG